MINDQWLQCLMPRLLAALLLLAACTPTERAGVEFPEAPVILISIDTLRSDHLPAYGYDGVKTPAIDGLAAESIVFDKAYSHVPMTLPAHVSMLTGLLPTEHGVRNNLGYTFDATAHDSLPARLRAAGYATGASVSTYVLRKETGMGALFDFYGDSLPQITGEAMGSHQRKGMDAAEEAVGWIRDRKSEPFFFMLHLYEPHAPYDPPEPYRSAVANPYDGEIATADAVVGHFIEGLKELGVWDRAIVVLTSDHGEGLYDHGEDQHGILLYREAIQVPLMIRLPRGMRGGARVPHPAQLIDLPATVTALLGIDAPRSSGRALLGADLSKPRSIYAETWYPRIHLGWSELRSLTDGKWQYIEAPRPELYDMEADPGQKTNVLADQRRVAAAFRTELDAFPDAPPQLGEVDPEAAARLAALGYIGSVRDPAAEGPLPNPVDRLGDIERMKGAFAAAARREFTTAEEILRGLVGENPGNLDAWDKLGEVLMQAGRHEEAIAVYRDAIARFPGFATNLVLSAGFAYLGAGDLAAAEEHAQIGMKGNPAKGHELMARVALERNDPGLASRELAAAIEAGHATPALTVLQAEAAQKRGQLGVALQLLDQAERFGVEAGMVAVPRLEYLRGDTLARLDRPEEARASYRKAVAQFPGDLQAWSNLAIVEFLLGSPREAEDVLARMVEANPNERARDVAEKTRAALN